MDGLRSPTAVVHPLTFSKETLNRLAAAGLDPAKLPRHVAVIMDGNGRWAQERGLERIQGHLEGVNSVRRTIEECVRLGIGQLTLYCFSTENWKRPQPEIDFLMTLLKEYLVKERPEIMRQDIRFAVIGRRSELTDYVLAEIDESLRASANNQGMTLCLAINYSGRAEIVDAMRTLAQRVRVGTLLPESIDEATIADALYTSAMPEPDLLIRSAGEMRISNFLLWQISYAELWVTEKCWPDFDEATLREALHAYAQRERRFGGLNA